MKGFRAKIVRGDYGHGGILAGVELVTIAAVIEKGIGPGTTTTIAPVPEWAQREEATEEAPAVGVMYRRPAPSMFIQEYPVCMVPVDEADGGIVELRVDHAAGPMFGGATVEPDDGAISEFLALVGEGDDEVDAKLHDRFETTDGGGP